MFITEIVSGLQIEVVIEPVLQADRKLLTKRRFAFDWKQVQNVFKLVEPAGNTILGVMAMEIFPDEERIEVMLLAVSKENVGQNKTYGRIAGSLLAYAARTALTLFGTDAAISLIPKTRLAQHYMDAYGFEPAGKSLFMYGDTLISLINNYVS